MGWTAICDRRAVRLWPLLAAMTLIACASAPAPAGGPAILFKTLQTFADPRAMTRAAVERTLGARLTSSTDGNYRFSSTTVGGVRLDSVELSIIPAAAELDLFPGADCITRADAESALGRAQVEDPLPSDTGRKHSWRRPAVVSRDWPSPVYRLEITFAGAGRCATQINIHHAR